MTRQETFDLVVAHAKTMDEPASVQGTGAGRHNTWCEYRTKDGRKCFAGALIPDELYHPGMENHAADDYESGKIMVADVLEDLGYEPKFVVCLQAIHDNAADKFVKLPSIPRLTFSEYVLPKLKEFAEKEKLDASQL
jgi:hypothetical protein